MSRFTSLLFLLLALCGSAIAQDEWSTEEFLAMTGVREGAVSSRELPGWQPNPVIVMRGDVGDGYAQEFPGTEFVMVSTRDELLAAAPRASVIIGFCDGDAIAAATRLVWVQIYSAGVERCLVVDELANGKVLLTNMQKMASPTIGEHAVAMALSLARGLVQYGRAMPDGEWRRDLASGPGMFSVSGKTLLVVGLGGIGSAAAKRAKALGMRVIATRNSSREGPAWVDYVGLSDELETLLGEADIVINALPLTDSTRGLFDRRHFDLMKRGAHFINVGRGGTVITDDLVAALDSGQLAGAGLDVTDPEPLPAAHPLWQMPNVIITPHVSGFGSDTRLYATLLRENLRRYLAGERLLNVVDPERGY